MVKLRVFRDDNICKILRRKNAKLDIIKIKNYCSEKNTVKTIKRQATEKCITYI